jgi:RimJ/RimL family protein N-acetyltransferase
MNGKKVFLRPIIRDDIVHFNLWKNDENVYKYLGGGYQPISIHQQEKWMDSLMNMTDQDRRFTICDLNEKPVGMIGLYNINWIHRVCEIGVFIGDKASVGKGYAKEACKSLERYAAKYLNIRKIRLNVVSENDAGIALWNSLGYKKIGEYKKERFIEGRYTDLTLMEKFIQEFS